MSKDQCGRKFKTSDWVDHSLCGEDCKATRPIVMTDTDRRKLELWPELIRHLTAEHHAWQKAPGHSLPGNCDTCDLLAKAAEIDGKKELK